MAALQVDVVAPSDRDRVMAALELAFAADPVMRWFWPDPVAYHGAFSRFVGAVAGAAFSTQHALSLDEGRAAALWLPPGSGADDEALIEVMVETIHPDLLMDVAAFGEVVHGHHPTTPHWYLPVTGVDPAVQGRGHGSTLLAHQLAICDRDGLPAYLEASTVRSRLLYERHGFQQTAVIQAASSPTVWAMQREPLDPR